MSDTVRDDTRSPQAVHTLELLTGLTGAAAAVYTELIGLTGGATVAELASAANLGRSTAGKALVTLEERGLTVRTPGGHDGPRRTPDRWHSALTPETTSGSASTQTSASVQEPPAPDAPEPIAIGRECGNTPANETSPHTPTTPGDGTPDPVTAPTTDAPQAAPPQNTEHGAGDDDEDRPHGKDGNNGPGYKDAATPQVSPQRQEVSTGAITLPGEKRRLAPGALRQLVVDHLQAHPGQAFTATRISRVIGRSSGAIANALVTLTRQGIAEQVSDQPRTYRSTTTATSTQ